MKKSHHVSKPKRLVNHLHQTKIYRKKSVSWKRKIRWKWNFVRIITYTLREFHFLVVIPIQFRFPQLLTGSGDLEMFFLYFELWKISEEEERGEIGVGNIFRWLTVNCWTVTGLPERKKMAKAMATDDVSWPANSKLRIRSRICSVERFECFNAQPSRSSSSKSPPSASIFIFRSSIFCSMNFKIVDRDCWNRK